VSADMIDWNVAVATARQLMRPGPDVSWQDAHDVVAELRALVPAAERHVSEFTGLVNPDSESGAVAVVDRIGWVQANLEGFQVLLEPLAVKLLEKRGEQSGIARTVSAKVAGVQVGTVLSYLASRVLGQYELFIPAGQGNGRLTLVAPNIVATERKLEVDPHDFRLWVTLHEVTHRTQFTAVPWLREYFGGQVREYIEASDLDPAELLQRLKAAAGVVRGAIGRSDEAGSIVDALQTPAQQAILHRLQALMSLVEGHGDFVMDGVGPSVVPTSALIRERFEQRRAGASNFDRMIRRLIGLELKMKQYAEGERFVSHVVDAVGIGNFNHVWTSPETLPTLEEIRDPQSWIARVGPFAVEAGPADGARDARA
jgi:coenzyme F420 biosynthesis associated uncharacterized protein